MENNKLDQLTYACNEELLNLLWSRLEDLESYIADVHDWPKEKVNTKFLPVYFRGIKKLDYRQYIYVGNKYIDAHLKRYMFEAALKYINVDVNADYLADISSDLTVRTILYLDNCFDVIFAYPQGANIVLSIKKTDGSVEITAKSGKKSIFFNPEIQ